MFEMFSGLKVWEAKQNKTKDNRKEQKAKKGGGGRHTGSKTN